MSVSISFVTETPLNMEFLSLTTSLSSNVQHMDNKLIAWLEMMHNKNVLLTFTFILHSFFHSLHVAYVLSFIIKLLVSISFHFFHGLLRVTQLSLPSQTYRKKCISIWLWFIACYMLSLKFNLHKTHFTRRANHSSMGSRVQRFSIREDSKSQIYRPDNVLTIQTDEGSVIFMFIRNSSNLN